MACVQLARELPEEAFAPTVTHALQRRCRGGEMDICRLLAPDDRPVESPERCTAFACDERLASRCDRGFPEACRELGRRRQSLALLARANRLAAAGCADGLEHECALLDHPSVRLRDQVYAWSRSCEHRSRRCSDVAQLLWVSGDMAGARYHLELACRLYDLCDELARSYRSGRLPELYRGRQAELAAFAKMQGLPETTARLRTTPRYTLDVAAPGLGLRGQLSLARAACLTGDLAACRRALPGHDRAVRARLADACAASHDRSSCLAVGMIGALDERDLDACSADPHSTTCREIALPALCELGDELACFQLADARRDDTLLRRTVQRVRANCEAGTPDCLFLETRRGAVPLSLEVFARSQDCQLGRGGCAAVARVLLAAGDPIAARYHLEVACQVFDQCDDLWEAYASHVFPELYPGRTADVRRQAMQASRQKAGS